jgi:hypothetical protein
LAFSNASNDSVIETLKVAKKMQKGQTTSDDAGGKSVSEKSKSTGGKCVSNNSTAYGGKSGATRTSNNPFET